MKKASMFFSLILLLTLIFSYTKTSANTYDYLTYTITNGEITITNCDTSVTSIEIPPSINNYPVTQISSYAFKGCEALTKVVIPNSVTLMGNSIFSGCSSLEELSLPFIGAARGGSEGVLSIKSVFGYIFGYKTQNEEGLTRQNYNSSSYAYYKIPSSLKTVIITDDTYIPYGAFENCSNITDISFSNSVTAIEANAFRNCKSLKEVAMSNNITTIHNNAFYNCEKLSSITIPNSVTTIGELSFAYCSSLTTILIPDNVTRIGVGAFANCTSLKEISLPFIGIDRSSSNTEYHVLGHIFRGSDSVKNTYLANQTYSSRVGATIKVYIPSSLEKVTITDATTIPYGAFSACSSIKSITVLGNISTIQSYAFYNCSNLEFVNISECINTIESFAFYGCITLPNITIPNNIKTIDESAFNNCTSLTTIYGYSNSSAEEFALQQKYFFIPINDSFNYHLNTFVKLTNNQLITKINSDKTIDGKYILIAFYSNKNVLISATTSIINGRNYLEYKFSDNPDAKYIKTFLWDSILNMIPCSDSKKVDIIR